MIKISYLILHYKNIDDTLKCIESIKFISSNDDWSIVVVDNGSSNGTGEQLENKYKNESNIQIVVLKENLGFSKGNNVGYSYIKSNINPQFIVVTNNDVIFFQKDFTKKIKNIFDENEFYVLGPDIYVRHNREHQSPIGLKPITKENLSKEILMYEYYQKHLYKYVLRRKLQNIKNNLYNNNKYFRKVYNLIQDKEEINLQQQYKNIIVQGACIIVSEKYIQSEDKMFMPEPFLYCEEYFLFYKCLKKGYLIVYDPRIVIWHEDSASIKKSSSNAVKKAEFTLKHHVMAREMLLKYIRDSSTIIPK